MSGTNEPPCSKPFVTCKPQTVGFNLTYWPSLPARWPRYSAVAHGCRRHCVAPHSTERAPNLLPEQTQPGSGVMNRVHPSSCCGSGSNVFVPGIHPAEELGNHHSSPRRVFLPDLLDPPLLSLKPQPCRPIPGRPLLEVEARPAPRHQGAVQRTRPTYVTSPIRAVSGLSAVLCHFSSAQG